MKPGGLSFNVLQSYGSFKAPLVYYVFDVLILAGRDVISEKLAARRQLLTEKVLPRLAEPIESRSLAAPLPELIRAVREQGIEGLVAKRIDSV